MVYKDMKHNSVNVSDTLKESKDLTASKLIKAEIDKTLAAINRIDAEILVEGTKLISGLNKPGCNRLLESSLFKGLKQSGLKSIEDKLYEYSLLIKNCDTEEDAMYILRGINTRLSILEDYIYNTKDISDAERKKWESVAMQYRLVREQLIKKKIANKKQYGLFFDYDQLDYLDAHKEQ